MFRGALDTVAGEIDLAEEALLDADTQLRNRVSALGRQAARLVPGPGQGVMLAAAGLGAGFVLWRVVRGRQDARPRRPTSARRARRGLQLPPSLVSAALTPVMGPRVAGLVGSLLAGPAVGGRYGGAHDEGPATAIQVDLDRLAGPWHEVAWLPDRHERTHTGRVETLFLPAEARGEEFRVINRRQGDGFEQQAAGVVRVVDDGDNARLQVSYAPPWLRWLPFAWDDQWVLDVDPAYAWVMLGTPRRDRLWLLSRSRRLPAGVFEELVLRAAARGYPVERVQRRLA